MAKVNDRLSIETPGLDTFERVALQMAAAAMAMRFCCPVFLVGSCMEKREAADIDLIMVVSNKQMIRLFGATKKQMLDSHKINEFDASYFKWAKFTKKYKHFFEDSGLSMDVDFKIQTPEEFAEQKGPRARLDPFGTVFTLPDAKSVE
jgi:hypothetical protein